MILWDGNAFKNSSSPNSVSTARTIKISIILTCDCVFPDFVENRRLVTHGIVLRHVKDNFSEGATDIQTQNLAFWQCFGQDNFVHMIKKLQIENLHKRPYFSDSTTSDGRSN